MSLSEPEYFPKSSRIWKNLGNLFQRIDFGEPGFLNRLYFRIGGMEPSRKASVTYLPDRPYMGVFKNPLISRDERKT
jgi:hypothetical protein